MTSEPLVWLPFEPAELGTPPSGLRYETVVPEPEQPVPDSVAEVAFYVPPYRLRPGDSALVEQMPGLRVVQTLTAGVEHIRSRVPAGVTLCNGRGIHDASTAELALTLVLSALRGIPEFVRNQHRARWNPLRRRSLADSRVLIVGYGAVGRAVEERLGGFEVEVDRVARTARAGVAPYDALPDLLPYADVVILTVPLTEQTRGLVDAGFLAAMADHALLVNVARGAVVDTEALLAELLSHRLSAALDVVDPEPLPEEHPLWQAPNLLVSPHVGGASTAMWPRAYRLVREQLERFAEDRPLANVMRGEY